MNSTPQPEASGVTPTAREGVDVFEPTARRDEAPMCEPAVAEVPTALFGDRVLIRPPPGVELVEDNPTFATTFASSVSSCDGTIDRMSLFVYEAKAGKTARHVLDEFVQSLEHSGYVGGTFDEPLAENPERVMLTATYPAQGAQPEARVLVSVAHKLDYMIVVFFQTRPSSWELVSPSFVASSNTLLVVPTT